VKLWIVLGSIVLFLLASFPAAAQHAQGGARRAGPAGPKPTQQQAPVRDANWQTPDGRRGGRMSPEERKQLRQDVNNHGRDIYRDRAGANRP